MIYTTNFASLKKIDRSNSIVISIAAYNPKWLKQGDINYWFSELAPTKGLLFDYKQGRCNWKEYEERYIKDFFNRKFAKEQANRVCELSQNKDIYLLCYEKSTDNCHRHILGDLFISKGYQVKEL